ncbi:MAG: 50S ribosomal protein L3, partial [Coleofasciculaceae cyanobacterium SM2_1_6]|nr:50S ribosomal protein L3 [Coleofasciculaceae cyanobacterium SM2_1_6]
MSIGILGTKVGMTQIFDQAGKAVPVTVIEAGPCHITQVKTEATDGYTAVQLGYGTTNEKNLSRPEKGHLAKSSAPFLKHLHEYRLADVSAYELGGSVKADIFTEGQVVDVIGTSIGKGFAGYQKRHNFARGPMSHGSKNHRQPGSTGAGTTPG